MPGAASAEATVAVVGICGARHLERCLEALERQEDAPPFDVVVVYDPQLTDIPDLQERFPKVRMISNEGQRSPLELASRAVREADGRIVLLTEDHCVPARDWVRRLSEACTEERAAVGGVVETDPAANAVDRAFYLVDFFRYMRPVDEGESVTLTVCNVAYRTDRLREIEPLWSEIFHETAVNDALRERFGPLWLIPDAEVRMRRRVRFGDALHERYAFGRLFGCTRLAFEPSWRRVYYAVLAPALPLLLLGRMTRKALVRRGWLRPYLEALPALTMMVLAWSWGEWLGYLTRKRPRYLVVAPEIREPRRNRGPDERSSAPDAPES